LGRSWELRKKIFVRADDDVMAEDRKWQIEGWGAAQGQIRAAIEFLCEGKSPRDRAAIADELAALVRSIARSEYPKLQTSSFDRDEHARESWARATAHHVVGGALSASERLPPADQAWLLREIARTALWHTPNSGDEVRKLVRFFDIENLGSPPVSPVFWRLMCRLIGATAGLASAA
jgi:hypothetical protein